MNDRKSKFDLIVFFLLSKMVEVRIANNKNNGSDKCLLPKSREWAEAYNANTEPPDIFQFFYALN